jgi:DNA-directed RNA polymerase specialized sigma24 family protein
VLVAIDVAGLSYAEASRALKVPEATVTSRLFRARRQAAAGMESVAPGVMGRDRT